MKEIKQDKVYTYDQFFTHPEVAQQCIDHFCTHYRFDEFDLIIEPSAGTGSFFNLLPYPKMGIEIDQGLCEKTPELRKNSFYNILFDLSSQYLVIGNPPFGTQSKEAIRFFNHAANFAAVIAFIVPRTWKKQAVQNQLDLNYHLVSNIDVPQGCFIGRKNTAVKCCFQIWKRSKPLRKKVSAQRTHPDWDFLPYIKDKNDLCPPKNADFVLLAYGSNSGQIDTDIYRWRPKSVHFIKSNISPDKLMKRFSQLDFSIANDSARQSSLGKAALVSLYKDKYEC